MEPKISPQEFREHYNPLPLELQEALLSEITAQRIESIVLRNDAKRHMSEIARLTGRVLLGVLSPARFVSALADHLQIDKQTASDIAQDINREIFFPVREGLKELYGITATQEPVARDRRPGGPEGLGAGVGGLETKQAFEPKPTRQPPTEPVQEVEKAEPKIEAEIEQMSQEPQPGAGPPLAEPPLNLPTTRESTGDEYKEPIESRDTENLPPPSPKPTSGPKIEGNVIDLKGIDVE